MKRPLLLIAGVLLILVLASAGWYASKLHFSHSKHASLSLPNNNAAALKLKDKAHSIAAYARKEGYNPDICFLVDMSTSAGKNRFYVYNPVKDSVLDAGLVTHGRCNKNWLTGRQYGNEVGCGCTSLGKYKIGKPYQGRFGLAYKLYGLDSTNNNAFKRFVVLHSHECVPEGEVDPYPICQSDGCPTVAPAFLKKLASILDASGKPILLWIYE